MPGWVSFLMHADRECRQEETQLPDPLHQAIAHAIRQQLDPAAFARCAHDLLQSEYYPGLHPIPPKRDTDMDSVAGPDAGPTFVLVATTAKDYRRNLRESIQRYLNAGSEERAFVLATTQEVTDESRLRLMRAAGERWGVELRAIHDRGNFEQLLYHSPRWRRELLGVTHSASALSRFPASTRASVPIPLIGRDSEIAQLRSADGDIVLTGKPGVGKTFLLERLADEDWGLFDLGWSVPRLKDAVFGMRPPRVMLDDAHLSPDRLDAVRQLRREMDGDFDFGIVAVSWPGRAGEVAAHLPDAERIDIEELERDRIVEIVEAAGVARRDLQRLIADQSRGRAGLAVALARACKTGGIDAVASGRKLLEDLAAWYRRTLGKKSHQVLGALALAGGAGATLEQVSGITGLSPAATSNLVRGLAEGGIIDEAERPLSPEEMFDRAQTPRPTRSDWLCVQPEALRYALVADVFYGIGSLPVETAVERLDPSAIAALPLIGAAHRDADVDRAWLRDRVIYWWHDEQAAVEYALLGPDEMRAALERASVHRTRIAEACYAAGVAPERALRVLMEQARGDDRAEPGAPDHPLRIVGDYLASPGAGMDARRLAVRVADAWLREGRDAYAGIRVLAHAVNPVWWEHSLDPGLGKTLTIREGVASPAAAAELGRIWDSILEIAKREQDNIPVAVILDALHPWVRPEASSWPRSPGEESAKALRDVAERIVQRLAAIFRERPGVLYRLHTLAKSGALPVRVDVPGSFATLFPAWRDADEYARGEAFVRRAEELADRPPAGVADELVLIDREAILAGIESPNEMMPRGARRLARELASRDERPEEMLAALEQRGADSGLLGWFLDRSTELRRPGWEEAIERLLGSSATAEAAIRTALVRPVREELKRLAIGQSAPWLGLIESLVIRDEIDDATLALLFEAPDTQVAQEAAMALGAANEVRAGRLERLQPPMLERWKEIVVSVPPDGGGSVSSSWSLARVLKQDHDLCARWLRVRFAILSEQKWPAHRILGWETQEAIASLPPEIKIDLIRDLPADLDAFLLGVYLPSLLAGSSGAAAALFDRSDLDDLHHLALCRSPGDDWPVDDAWMERALLAMDRGWEPERIVESLMRGRMSWSGDESAHLQRQADAFKRLHSPEQPDGERRERIAAAGFARFRQERDRARRAERNERVFGSRR